jgi:class 3 adenylate cyclase
VTCAACGQRHRAGARFCDACGLCLERARGYTPNHLAQEVLAAGDAVRGERKTLTVLFVDVLASMELAGSVDAERWHRVMDRFFGILSDGIHAFGGTINQFTGDGVMALFGAPVAHEDHARRACAAALDLRQRLDGYARELERSHGLAFRVRMGLNSGEAVVGAIGDELRRDYTAQGQMVGLAARIEQLADPGATYLSQHTAALVEGLFELRDLGIFDLKGVRGPVRVYQLLGEGPLRTRLDVSRARGFSRFVGRGEEMRALEAALEHAIRGRGQVVGVVAEAGVGKSRLCFEFAERCRARGVLVRRAQALSHGEMIPLRPVLEMLRGFFGVSDRDGDAAARQKIAGAVVLSDPELGDDLPLLLDFLGVPDPAQPAPRLDPEARQARLFGIVTRLVQALSRREPAVLLVEDLHWLDPGSEAFLEHLVEVVSATRTLVLANFRPDYRTDWMSRSSYQQIPLHPLGDEAVTELLDDLLGPDPSVRELARAIRERTGGNPFFVEEVVKSLVDSGNLEGEREAYRLVTPVERIAVPATVQAVLAARIDRLPEREKRLLQCAAVIGRSFPAPLLRRVCGLPPAAFEEALRALLHAELLCEERPYPTAEYAFKHPVTQEVTYASQLAEPRARIHAEVARAIEELHADRIGEFAALLAHHAEAAGAALDAARWHRRAAEWVGISDPAAAHRHWRAVLASIGDSPQTPEQLALAVQARHRLLQLAWRLGLSAEETEHIFATGVALAKRAGDGVAGVSLALGYAIHRGVSGDELGQHRHARDAARIADRMGNVLLSLGARGAIATALHFLGRLAEGIEVATRAIDEAPDDPAAGVEQFWISPYAFLLALRGALRALRGSIAEGERDLVAALELAAARGEAELEACVHGFLVQHAWCSGDAGAGLAHAARAVELAERTGIPLLRADAHQYLCQANLLARDFAAASAAGERALAIVRQHASMAGPEPRILAGLAEAALGLGDAARARELAEAVAAAARARHTRLVELSARIALARAALRLEGAAAAAAIQDALATALALSDKTGARCHRPLVHLALAEVAEHAGDAARRERQLREAARLHGELGAAGHVERLAGALADAG